MKKTVALIFTLVISLMLFSCGENENGVFHETETETERLTDIALDTELAEPELFPVKYIRTGSYREGVDFPYTVTIGSRSELDSYIVETAGEHYSLGQGEFFDVVSSYDEEFFSDNMLVFAVLQEGSGSIRHELIGVTADDIIQIKRITPEVGTCDMAEWHIIIEMPRERAEEHSFTAEYYGEDNRELAVFGQDFVYMSARVPKGWTYEIRGYDTTSEATQQIGIEFRPQNDPEVRVSLLFYTGFLGMCGTGLISETVTIGIYSAVHHMYENMNDWHLYRFEDLPGEYALEISGVEKGSEYESNVGEIIDTLTLGIGLGEDEAIELAKAECTVEYDDIRAKFDFINGLWSVNFSKRDTVGGDQTVKIYMDGKYHSSEYGE